MSTKEQILDLMQDGEKWTQAELASAIKIPGFALTSVIREMCIDTISFDGKKNGQDSWRRRTLKSRMPRLDKQVDDILATSLEGHQPNDENAVTSPLDPDAKWFPETPSWMKDSPHWILDAMGWMVREPGDTKSNPPMDSPIRWMGGKSKMLTDLIAWYPEHYCYVEGFGGSLKPFFAKEPSKIEVVNDFYTELINFWRVASQWPSELAEACNDTPASRTLHRLFQRSDGTRSAWERAVIFGSLVRFSFNGKPWSSFGGSPSAPATKIDAELLKGCAARLSDPGVYIENLDFRALISRYNKKVAQGPVFFYLDPPYYKTAGYADAFPDEWHMELAQLMIDIANNGNLVLMTNSPQSMDAYKRWFGQESDRFYYETYTVKYSAAGSVEGRGDVEETIISNFPLKVSSQKRQTGMF